MLRFVLASFGSLLSCAIFTVAAEEKANTNAPCQITPTYSSTILRRSGTNSIILDNGSEVVLAGLLLPTALDIPAKTATWPPEKKAAEILTRLIVGKSLHFADTNTSRDRYGRRIAHAFLRKNDKTQWIQARLVELGQARVDVEALSLACAETLLKKERTARNQSRGLWRYTSYAARPTSAPWRLLKHRGSYQIVEGTVTEIGERRSRLFINFGTDKQTDFTAGLFGKKAHHARLNGQPLTVLKGRKVRIRGWVSWRGGPFIHIRTLAQIALLQPLLKEKMVD